MMSRAIANACTRKPPRSQLEHKLLWYVENYGLCLNTVKRNRRLLDEPRKLFLKILWQRGPQPDLSKLNQYIQSL
ncbi:MAG: hypothetical protein QOG67_2542 [Verrucomicrobiota bacterium]